MKSLWTLQLREGRQEKDVTGDESIKSVGEQARRSPSPWQALKNRGEEPRNSSNGRLRMAGKTTETLKF